MSGSNVPRRDITGQRFGHLTAIRPTEKRQFRNVVWECLCDCGTTCEIAINALTHMNRRSCGCISGKDITGERFGRLVAIKPSESKSGASIVWECLCDCGNIKHASQGALAAGNTLSCGCLKREANISRTLTHGQAGTPEYACWINLRGRCNNPNYSGYENYGGRGIKVCEEWDQSFDAFLAYVGPRPSPDHSLDRWPNNDGNYEPGNVRWGTWTEQAANKRPRKPRRK